MRRLIPLLLTILVLAACHKEQRPLVGISCARSASGGTNLAKTYTNAITRAGGLPVILPTVSDPAVARDLLNRLDGIVFSGGEDVDPSRYGETVWNETVHVDSIRDNSDFLLAEAALASGKPILAICRGHQMVNVAMGGSLIQDIPTQVPDSLIHSGGAMHKIGVDKDSFLYQLYGQDSLEVNSFHHQAVKDPAPGVHVTARTRDGVIEAYEAPGVLAFQFHPEKMVEDDPFWLPLFEAYVDRLK